MYCFIYCVPQAYKELDLKDYHDVSISQVVLKFMRAVIFMAVKFRLGTKAPRLPTDLESQCPLSSMNFWMYTSGKGASMGQDWDYVSTVRAEEL